MSVRRTLTTSRILSPRNAFHAHACGKDNCRLNALHKKDAPLEYRCKNITIDRADTKPSTAIRFNENKLCSEKHSPGEFCLMEENSRYHHSRKHHDYLDL